MFYDYDLESYRKNKCIYMISLYAWEKKFLFEQKEKSGNSVKNILTNALAVYIADMQDYEKKTIWEKGKEILKKYMESWESENKKSEDKLKKKYTYSFRLYPWEKIVLYNQAKIEGRTANKIIRDAIVLYAGSLEHYNQYKFIKNGQQQFENCRQYWRENMIKDV